MRYLSYVATLLTVAFLLPLAASAQKGVVEKMALDSRDLRFWSSSYSKKDNNGNPCAVIKVTVMTPEGVVDDKVTFEGNVKDTPELKTAEYWVYMPEGQKWLKLMSPQLQPMTVNFADHGIEATEKGRAYALSINILPPDGQAVRSAKHFLRLSVTPWESKVSVDGKAYAVEDGRIDIPLKKGTHTYRVECKGYITDEGNFTMTNQNISMPIRLKSEKGEPLFPFMAPNQKWGFRDRNRKTIIKPEFDKIFQAGSFYWVRKNDKMAMFDDRGEQLTTFDFDEVTNANQNGVFKVKTHGKAGIINSKGRLTVPCTLDQVIPSSSSMIIIVENGRFGAIDRTGEMVVPCEYQEITDFRQGLAVVMKDGLLGYMNEEGEIVIPIVYESAGHFSAGRARVVKDGEIFNIDLLGNRLPD